MHGLSSASDQTLTGYKNSLGSKKSQKQSFPSIYSIPSYLQTFFPTSSPTGWDEFQRLKVRRRNKAARAWCMSCAATCHCCVSCATLNFRFQRNKNQLYTKSAIQSAEVGCENSAASKYPARWQPARRPDIQQSSHQAIKPDCFIDIS